VGLCILSRTNLARARHKHLSAENSERLSLYLVRELGLSEEERLSLKAEVMGRPGNKNLQILGSEVRCPSVPHYYFRPIFALLSLTTLNFAVNVSK
jgi:hypothetical protein